MQVITHPEGSGGIEFEVSRGSLPTHPHENKCKQTKKQLNKHAGLYLDMWLTTGFHEVQSLC